MIIHIYKDGERVAHDIPNVYPDEAVYFMEHAVVISMEELGGKFVIYGDYGQRDEAGEPIEAIVIASEGESCKDSLAKLRQQIERIKNEHSTSNR